MRPVRTRGTLAIGGALVAALVAWRTCGATRVPDPAISAIDAFLDSIDRGTLEESWRTARVVASMRDVLGQRRDTGDATLAASHDGGARLDVEVPVTCEHGAIVMALALVRAPGGAWSVSDCAARSAAFVWRFR